VGSTRQHYIIVFLQPEISPETSPPGFLSPSSIPLYSLQISITVCTYKLPQSPLLPPSSSELIAPPGHRNSSSGSTVPAVIFA
jgi:hypothetical protein